MILESENKATKHQPCEQLQGIRATKVSSTTDNLHLQYDFTQQQSVSPPGYQKYAVTSPSSTCQLPSISRIIQYLAAKTAIIGFLTFSCVLSVRAHWAELKYDKGWGFWALTYQSSNSTVDRDDASLQILKALSLDIAAKYQACKSI